ncbi:nucleotidyltransferase family protein [Candidatus Micrarchaeota archaeon]|nr:nucleotidyltransferase family protein [Candidatus Micrarchaeota archaeon]
MYAVVFAAGAGTRLAPYTHGIPKPLVPVSVGKGRIKVVVERLLEQLKNAGVTDVFMVVNYKKDAIMDYFGDGGRFGLDILYCYQEQLNGDAGGLYLCNRLLTDTFIAIDADNYYGDDDVFKKVLEYHQKHKPTATIATTEVDNVSKYAIVKLDKSGKVLDLVEKPLKSEWGNNAKLGIYVYEPEIFKHDQRICLSETGSFSNTQLLKSLIGKGHEVRATKIDGYFTDIGTWDNYEQLINWIGKHEK